MTAERKDPPRLLIEQLHLGELSETDARTLESATTQEERERALNEVRAANASFAEAHSEDAMLRAIRDKVRVAEVRAEQKAVKETHGARSFVLPAMLALGIGLIGLLQVGPQPDPTNPGASMEASTRLKGLRSHVVVYKRGTKEPLALEDGAHVRPGDVLQLAYVAKDAGYGVILSIDGAGQITQHLPEQGSAAAKLTRGGEQHLPHAYELDAAPMFERFFMVTGDAPFDADRVLAAARELTRDPLRAQRDDLTLPHGLSQRSITLVKE